MQEISFKNPTIYLLYLKKNYELIVERQLFQFSSRSAKLLCIIKLGYKMLH